MMTLVYIVIALVIGFLLGENRAVKSGNAILDEHQRLVLEAFKEVATDVDIRDEPIRPHFH
ncbi:hypothetical protein GTW25_05845 [Aliihoeflea aestuarii]|jgi:hypothetical protein|uniref:hypothetical protein n=1 Tax=Aliihoeflea aestuarii TaxID=453840 RepID=UPI0020938C95|nr:hypothetical protein [Aliihoeflea aestuarii]MCO6390548.1 hypothetical protein [Aliihoeflea aestuarii]